MRLNDLIFKKKIKFYFLGFFMLSVTLVFSYSIYVNPPVGAAYNKMPVIKADMQQLLLQKKSTVLYENETKKSELVSLLVIVNPEGWGGIPLPGDVKILANMGWYELIGTRNVFCKNNMKLIFNSGTYNNQSSMNIVMSYSGDTAKECKS